MKVKSWLNRLTYHFFWLLNVFFRASLRHILGRKRRDILLETIGYKGLRQFAPYVKRVNFPVVFLSDLPWGKYLTTLDRAKRVTESEPSTWFEPEVYEWVDLKKGDIAIDLGAHRGWYTLYFSRKVGKTGHVIAVEPCPQNLAFLHENIRLNSLCNVEVIPCAVSDKQGNAQLIIGNHSGRHTLMLSTNGETEKIRVSTITLDDILSDLGKIDLVKIDIEGAELVVLNACKQLNKVERFIIEVHREEYLKPLISLVEKNQFKAKVIAENRLVATKVYQDIAR